MTLNDFLTHWSITENPFRGEEARDDSVFARMSAPSSGLGVAISPSGVPSVARTVPTGAFHSDFDKIMGDLGRPSTSIVFGEKGSGKTAIRLQITTRVAHHNIEQPAAKVLLVAFDDLNAFLGRFSERVGGKTALESFQTIRLVDHMDAILLSIVPRLVDAILGATGPLNDAFDLGSEPKRAIRRLDGFARRDLLLLQAIYDRPDNADQRTPHLRRRLNLWMPAPIILGTAVLWLVPVVLIALFLWGWQSPAAWIKDATWPLMAWAGLAALYVIFALKFAVWDRMSRQLLAKKIRRRIRVTARTPQSYASSLRQVDRSSADAASLPISESDEPRYAMFARLRRTLGFFGYSGMLVLLDRVDEPTLVSGDPDRMRAIVWPLLNNKFLQQEGVGVKMLLPVELRHALFKESSAFFQDARLDKQNLIERLNWTGPMLYDLCDARLQACRAGGAPPMSLLDMFAEDVTRQDLVDALDQMHQPRDAFKFLYHCMTEHTSGVTRDQNAWRIPRLVLEHIRKQESDRVQQLYRGIRPA